MFNISVQGISDSRFYTAGTAPLQQRRVPAHHWHHPPTGQYSRGSHTDGVQQDHGQNRPPGQGSGQGRTLVHSVIIDLPQIEENSS